MKKTKKSIFLHPVVWSPVLVLLFAGILFLKSETFGAAPSGKVQRTIEKSPHFDLKQNIFVNRRPRILETMTVWQDFWADPLGKKEPNFMFNSNQGEPEKLLPEIKNPNLLDFQNNENGLKFIWLGHWTLLLSIDGKIILVDPVFSNYASPVPIFAKRFQSSALTLDQLPPVDLILLSHDHYDHLDIETIKYFVDKDVSFLTPLGVGAHLRYWGISNERITELDWWDNVTIDGLNFSATPAQHFSGRGIFNGNKTLWASWVLKGISETVYFSGDSGYDTHYQEIGDAFGPFDLVFMDYGQYDKGWRAVHNLPVEGIKAFEDLNGEYFVPVGWGMFNLAVHNWYDPPVQATKLSRERGIKLITPRIGQVISMENPPLFDEWWLDHIK